MIKNFPRPIGKAIIKLVAKFSILVIIPLVMDSQTEFLKLLYFP